jgi:PhnB protein
MSAKLNPYIHFKNNTKEAMEFYTSVFGGKLTMSTFGEAGVPADKAKPEGIMHSELITDNGMSIMAADTPEHMAQNPGNTVSISLSGDDEALLKGYWEKLSQAATITVPFDKAPWGDMFGMLIDKFGIEWLVNVTTKKS